MRATFIYGAGDVRVEDAPDPVLQAPTDALVRVVRACVCGSDLHPYHDLPASEQGRPIGHEFVSVVEETGPEVSTLRRGDFVIAPFAYSDNTCEFCREGLHTSERASLTVMRSAWVTVRASSAQICSSRSPRFHRRSSLSIGKAGRGATASGRRWPAPAAVNSPGPNPKVTVSRAGDAASSGSVPASAPPGRPPPPRRRLRAVPAG
ncbi:hypothetical protein Ppa06_42130 [Planomonospora parontospora subsp. parontospora]|uniref:Alcohol dehydrogenase-like N-terminal domain-containing protein n=2 Tax=Planomonospora parontospora TaxID=58119 RepID=A0AA37BKK8_9ACTN|nr:hypothetical protein GCM10010126_47990 [Planomonospora parontospora]GII10415.1 hypothetical protein Ppa06_42130 [Planomonospora parontospora subsp. parontospora]